MVVILSESNDIATNKVIDWLLKWKEPFIRVNENDQVFLDSITLENDISRIDFDLVISSAAANKAYRIRYSQVKSYWYRRHNWEISNVSLEHFKDQPGVLNYLHREYKNITDFIHFLWLKKPHINSYFDNSLNKLYALSVAKEIGFDVPKTIITSEKSKIKSFSSSQLISKSIGPIGFIELNSDEGIGLLTERVDLDKIHEQFFPSLFQEEIQKIGDIRSFYLHGKIFSTIILSQNDPQTQTDFRNYNYENPNRTPPFNLPSEIKQKIRKLMKLLNLNSGSLDIVLGADKRFYFLEVNPVGQFLQVSWPGNFNIEKEIAYFLKNGTRQK